ncbi:MAG: tetratricopeptide repeat protein [Alphaproteobacteria bacterium]|nr:tetratricopeptide repeat protein [Alphaproteobacteria bacterium]MBU1281471.1 tetratricopeptide repeat protein [Alphaproteobacteria bacterium]MBU1571718.1 tetratricopeptide repeat protein [Alphaproteobacteria bacterium]MBU1830692.1 tetratricopeptide repeat protein [Alphaproteobacteria bacterium]MBU2078554.1 tetratricopeptide repeat protein [Alphaproteobacteria bacterium]
MSQTDSFIDEVTEEVRRDKFYAFLRKYGWIGILAVCVLVGGAAWNEYAKAQARTQAEAMGDALTSALEGADATARAQALAEIGGEGDVRVITAMLRAGELHAAGDAKGAIAALAPFTADAMLDPVYRDLAVLKTAMIGAGDIPAEERVSQLAGIAAPGAPYRLLAEEQIAAAQVEMGQVEAAIDGYRAISQDGEASNALRRRALQMIVALGADPAAE